MFRKMILGATAVVALGAAVMSPSAAEAKHWKKHHHFHRTSPSCTAPMAWAATAVAAT